MLPSGPMPEIETRIARARERIAAAAGRAGRSPAEVTLMAVTKTVGPPTVQAAVDAGVVVLGENRVQEAEAKAPAIRGPAQWHLIGRLQSNKARRAVAVFHTVQSVDRTDLLQRLDRLAGEAGRRLPVWVQVEFARGSAGAEEIDRLARTLCVEAAATAHLQLCGLMTLPPYSPDPEAARPYFRRLRQLRDAIVADEGVALGGLSMGMSGDFEVAVEEGSTMVRLGTILFGPRD